MTAASVSGARRGLWSAGRTAARGFTLIELLVVMVLIVIVIGTVGLGLGGSDSRAVQQEAARLALLVRTAHQEAILEGEVYAVALAPDGYRFLVLNNRKGKFEAIRADQILRPRRLPPNMSITSVTINGASAGNRPELILLPTGELPEFDIVIGRDGVSWSIQGTADGVIRTVRRHA
ncbi:MAG: type II secretion system minor pseudopilin GspH [Gammaproteobacteria bacterium]|nr:type II secretion system minor pseudopilin GspH [Gammaproteobacteria bacterium]